MNRRSFLKRASGLLVAAAAAPLLADVEKLAWLANPEPKVWVPGWSASAPFEPENYFQASDFVVPSNMLRWKNVFLSSEELYCVVPMSASLASFKDLASVADDLAEQVKESMGAAWTERYGTQQIPLAVHDVRARLLDEAVICDASGTVVHSLPEQRMMGLLLVTGKIMGRESEVPIDLTSREERRAQRLAVRTMEFPEGVLREAFNRDVV